MSYDRRLITLSPCAAEGAGYAVLYDGTTIARVKKITTLSRGWSKSNMSTWHRIAWQASLDGVEGIDQPQHMHLGRALRERDRRTRKAAVDYVLECYEKVGVPLPTSSQQRAA